MTFEEMIALLINPPEDGLPETIYDDLARTYNNDVGIRDEKIALMESETTDGLRRWNRRFLG